MLKISPKESLSRAFPWFILTVAAVLSGMASYLADDSRNSATAVKISLIVFVFCGLLQAVFPRILGLRQRKVKPVVLWFTGLSGSGKSTLSEKVYNALERAGVPVEHLDGDKIRDTIRNVSFTKDARNEHIKRVGLLASFLEGRGNVIVASFVSPYSESRDYVRSICKNFVEIYISTPLEVCEKRDVKGLYAKARRGEIANFTGISDPYEAPRNPELQINTSQVSLDDAADQVLKYIRPFVGTI